MTCTCDIPDTSAVFQEHELSCPFYEPPLTQAEIRQLRTLLGFKQLGVVLARPFPNPQVDSRHSGGETGS